MTKLIPKAKVTFELTMTISERAAHALDALAGYGDDEFLKVFYAKLGQHYLKPHEGALRELFAAVRAQLPSQLHAVKEARAKLFPRESLRDPIGLGERGAPEIPAASPAALR